MKISVMLQFGYYEWAPFLIATEAQRRQALFLFILFSYQTVEKKNRDYRYTSNRYLVHPQSDTQK